MSKPIGYKRNGKNRVQWMISIFFLLLVITCGPCGPWSPWGLWGTAFGAGLASPSSPAGPATIDTFDYPELSVAPRASERLKIESTQEDARAATQFLAFQISAVTTMTAGFLGFSDPVNPSMGYIGAAVGGGWLALTVVLALTHRPYSSGYAEVRDLPNGTTREQLVRERRSEQAIEEIARMGERLKWASVLTNLGASILMLSKYSPVQNTPPNTGTSWSAGQSVAVGAAALSLLPLFLRTHWCDVQEQQENYKKRIFAPVANGTLYQDPVNRTVSPEILLSFQL
jgi:hypothetical protein